MEILGIPTLSLLSGDSSMEILFMNEKRRDKGEKGLYVQ
ncbi:hypothetical protein EMIT0180MI3_20504 [Priestia megaterium]